MSSTSFFQFKAQKELFRAALTGDNIKLQKAIDSGALVNKKTTNNVTALYCAISRGYTDTVKLLLENKADTHLTYEGEITPLEQANFLGFKDISRMLKDAEETDKKLDRVRTTFEESTQPLLEKPSPLNKSKSTCIIS